MADLNKSALDIELAFQTFREMGKELNEEKLRSLGVLTNQAIPTIGGIILFGKKEVRDRFFPDVTVRCARFLGETKSFILDQWAVEGSILDAVAEVPKFISRNTRTAAIFGEMQRKDVPEYAPRAIREALINALAHADYSLIGSHIQIAIFSNRLEIQSPGMFPFGFTMEDLKAGVSRIRNRVIARVFHELLLMEEWGSGYKRIIDACKDAGYPEPKVGRAGNDGTGHFLPSRKDFSP